MKVFIQVFVVLFSLVGSGMFSCNLAQDNPSFDIDILEYRTFKWFWDLADKENFQIPDRWPNHQFSSIAATGYGLAAYIVGSERGFVTRAEAADRVTKTLRILEKLPQGTTLNKDSGYRGFFYHFLDKDSALRFRNTELSTIDTGLLMAGVLACMSYFDKEEEREIRMLAEMLYRRVEYSWMLNPANRLSMGWRPESGFIHSDWQGYNEAMILLIQALGSPDHSIPSDIWDSWTETYSWRDFYGQDMINFGPLFGHQYSQIFIDFREIQDTYCKEKGIDYFENSRRATLANRAYCIENPGGYKGYGPAAWGLTACDGPIDDIRNSDLEASVMWMELSKYQGYSARGAAADFINDDGTLAPTAAGGSIPFAPEECIAALKYMWEMHYDSLVDEHGFKDAFNLSATFAGQRPGGWFAPDKLGIDQGAILLMIANYKDDLIWNQLKKNPFIVRGLQRAGFEGGWLSEVVNPDYGQNIFSMKNDQIPYDPKGLFESHVFSDQSGNQLPYRWMVPSEFNESDRYPLVIFLHGAGERGANNRDQLKNGVMTFAEPNHRSSFPAFVLAPQCPEGFRWSEVDQAWRMPKFSENPTRPMQSLIELIDHTLATQPGIDTERIYVVGLSMGGFGGFDLMARNPGLFAAGMLLCSGADDMVALRIKDIPVSIFHCATDMTVSVERSRSIVKALQAQNSPVVYKEYQTLGHAIWQETLYNFDHLRWIFKQKKHMTYDE